MHREGGKDGGKDGKAVPKFDLGAMNKVRTGGKNRSSRAR